MHSFFRAIGFSEIESDENIQRLYEDISKSRMSEKTYISNKTQAVYKEHIRYYGHNIGIIWTSSYDREKDKEIAGECYPFFKGEAMLAEEGFSAEKRAAGNTYLATVDEPRSNVMVIFGVINTADYMKLNENGMINAATKINVAFSGLSTEGVVLLPIQMSKRELKRERREANERVELLQAAKKGDETAMETLTFKDLNAYTNATKRIIKEDLFSIVRCSFMPYGLECDRYSVVADIESVGKIINTYTNEKIWLLRLNINGIFVDTAINEKDLVGEPSEGRRFKGNILLQAYITERI